MTEHRCPLWHEPLVTLPRTAEGVYLVYSPRAGGVYGLQGGWAGLVRREQPIGLLRDATDRQKASLSHWIYRQNLKAGLLRPPEATLESRHEVLAWGWEANRLAAPPPPCLDPETVKAQYARIPSALDRRLTLLNELLLQQDIPPPQDKTTRNRMYADYAGCRAAAAAWDPESGEEEEFWDHLKKEGWDASGQSIWLSCVRVPAHETRKSRGRISGLSFYILKQSSPCGRLGPPHPAARPTGPAAPTGPFCPHNAADSRPSRAWPGHARGGSADPDAPTDSHSENTLVNPPAWTPKP